MEDLKDLIIEFAVAKNNLEKELKQVKEGSDMYRKYWLEELKKREDLEKHLNEQSLTKKTA